MLWKKNYFIHYKSLIQADQYEIINVLYTVFLSTENQFLEKQVRIFLASIFFNIFTFHDSILELLWGAG